jgi:hypothetical protein
VTAIHDRALDGARTALGERYAGHFAEGERQTAEEAVAALESETEQTLARAVP